MEGERIVLFELNEVPFRVIDHYCAQHPDSTFGKLLHSSRQFRTHIEAKQDLSPWRTWPTVHRGVPDWRHQITNFGEDLSEVNKAYPPIWQLLRRAGVQTGVFNSLHSYPVPADAKDHCFFVPDPFATESTTFPTELEPFQDFVLSVSRGSARNVERSLPWHSANKLALSLPYLGLQSRTLAGLFSQLWSERLNSSRVVRRRTFQAVLAFDVFMRQLQNTRPQFSTFFTNHVASALHRYWAATFPGDYDHFEYSPKWVATYGDEIDFSMTWLDHMLSRLVEFVTNNRDYALWITSSMGQEATVALAQETQLYLTDVDKFMRRMGFASGEYQRRPAMLPQVNVQISSEKVHLLEEALLALRIGEQPVSYRIGRGVCSVDFGHSNLPARTPVRQGDFVGEFADFGLTNVEIQEKSGTNAYHVPQGCLILFDARGSSVSVHPARAENANRPEVSVLELAPALLRNFGIRAPEYMVKPSRFVR